MKTNTIKRISGLLLLASLLCAAMTACGDSDAADSDKQTDAVSDSGETTIAETLPPYDFFEETLDYGGYNFRILNNSSFGDSEVDILKENLEGGDIVNESVYERNMCVEELLNIEISEVLIEGQSSNSWERTESTIAQNVMADDDAFDAVCSALIEMFRSSSSGYLLDFNDITTLDMSNPWWNRQVIEAFNFGNDKTYVLSGGINYRDEYGQLCLYFNRELFNENDFELPYEAVKNGEWDFDMMYGYIKDFERDLNGNGEMDENDQYGYVANQNIINHIGAGFDMLAIRKDVSGVPEFRLDEAFYDRFSTIIDTLCNDPSVVVMERKFGYDIGNAMFSYGHILFCENLVGSCVKYRSTVDFDLGVLPMPKYNESQESYMCTVSDAYASAYGVPITNRDTNRTGYILDAMGYFGEQIIYPAVIEKNILVKAVRDEESIEMFDIIFQSKAFDLAYITGWGDWSRSMQGFAYDGKNTLASKEAKYSKRLIKDIEKSLAAFEIEGY